MEDKLFTLASPNFSHLAIVAASVTAITLTGCGKAFTSGTEHLGDSGVTVDTDSGSNTTSTISKDGLLLWLRSDRGVSMDNGFVSSWADQSGLYFDARQDQMESRPTLVVAGIGGHAALRFDGVDDFFQLPSGMADFSAGLSVFVVVNEQQPDSYNSFVEFSNGGEVDDISFGEYQDQIAYEVLDQATQGNAVTYDTPQILAVIHRSDSTLVMRRNGATAGAAVVTLPDVITREQNFVGQSLYSGSETYPGVMGEVLVYGRALSDSETLNVENDLQRRWNCCN